MNKLISTTIGIIIVAAAGFAFQNMAFSSSTWNAYKNKNHNFQIQYPSDWKLQEYTMRAGKKVIYAALDPKNTISQEASETMDVPRGLIEIGFCEDTCNNSIDAAIAAQLPDVRIGHGSSVPAKKQEKITDEKEPNPAYSSKKIISYYIGPLERFGDFIICEVVITYTSDLDEKYLKDFIKILSTVRYTSKFKFSDPLPVLPNG